MFKIANENIRLTKGFLTFPGGIENVTMLHVLKVSDKDTKMTSLTSFWCIPYQL